jgi:hypothetical protein
MENEELLQDAEEQGTRGGDIPRTYQETEADKALAGVISMTGSIGGVEETKEDLDVPEPLSTKVRQASDEDFGSESEESEETESSVSAEESGGAEEPDEDDKEILPRDNANIKQLLNIIYRPKAEQVIKGPASYPLNPSLNENVAFYLGEALEKKSEQEKYKKYMGRTQNSYGWGIIQTLKSGRFERDLPEKDLKEFLIGFVKIAGTGRRLTKLPQQKTSGGFSNGYNEKNLAEDEKAFLKKGFGLKKRDVRLSRHQEELQVQGQLDQLPRVSFKKRAGRPSVKIGKGIDIQVPQDNYKTFGKHLIHYPALRDDYKMSVKYPSRSKNVGKIIVVSPDYREMIMDLLERGALSDRLYDKLSNDEKKHFNQAVKASGLIETLKLKPIDEDKKDLVERFKVLRGEFIAGNDAPSMLKELRALVLHFMESGQIPKTQGYDLLKELSAVEK